jgi:hypothetical protein
MDKSSSLGMPMSPQEISKTYKLQSLGMPWASPSSSTKISGHLSRHYIFIASYTMCYSWSVSCFLFFVFFYFICYNKCLVWESDIDKGIDNRARYLSTPEAR